MQVTTRTFSRGMAPCFFLGFLLCFSGIILIPTSLDAAEVKIFRADSREDVLQGELNSLALEPLGGLRLARRVERLARLEEPFVWTAAAHPDGWVLGTGNAGKVLLVKRSGGIEELFTAPEPEVFAVTSDAEGTVYVGTSPHGKVYRIPKGGVPEGAEATVVFDSEDAYIWDLTLDNQGRLLIATGLSGRLYRVDPKKDLSQAAGVLYQSPDSHVRATLALEDGRVLVGTAGQGLVLEIVDTSPPSGGKSKKAKAETVAVATLYDAVQPEILSFTADADGNAYVAVLASEASQVDLSKTQPPAKEAESNGEAKVSVATTQDATTGSRGSGYTGPRSVVLRIRPNGEVDEIAALQKETIHSVLWHGDSLWIGTGQDGRLFRYQDERLVLERDLEERQIVALVGDEHGDEHGAAVVTTNAAALYHIPGGTVTQGTYTSKVLDAVQVSRFGSLLWRGEMASGSSVGVEARSGLSSTPDATWTSWMPLSYGSQPGDRELALSELSAGRFIQWRSTLQGGGADRITSTELSYRQQNQKPKIDSLEVLDPGQILVPSSFNVQNQTYEPWSPNREGIFTSLGAEKDKDGSRLKNLWKKGYRTVRWTASDDNDDELTYSLSFRREDPSRGQGQEESPWLNIVKQLDETSYSFDATVLPDGAYRFQLAVSDQAGQADGEGLVAEKTSESVIIDHSPPVLGKVQRGEGHIEVELRDALSPMRNVVYSLDAAPWKSVRVDDGLLDGRSEVVKIEVPKGTQMLLLRATDAAFNVITFDLLNATSP